MGEVLDQGQVIADTIQGALSSFLDESLTMEALDEVARTLVTVGGQARGVIEQLPAGNWKMRLSEGVDRLMELGPIINGKEEPLKDLVDEVTDIGTGEWSLHLHQQLVGEKPNLELIGQVEAIMDIL